MPVEFTLRSRTAGRALRGRIAPTGFALGLATAVASVPCETPAQIAGTGDREIAARLVRASLVSDAAAIAPGRSFRLAVRLQIEEGWHLNWLNPGDAGLAPGVAWRMPRGFRSGASCWPLPERYRTGPLVIFGYSGELLLVVDVRSPVDLTPGVEVDFRAEVSWLACADACIPGSATVSISLPVEASPRLDAAWVRAMDASVGRCPQPAGAWTVQARLDDNGGIALDIQTAGDAVAEIDDAFFFPYHPGFMENAAPQRLSVLASPTGRAAYQLRVELSRMAAEIPARLSGILVSRSASNDAGARAIEIDVPLMRR